MFCKYCNQFHLAKENAETFNMFSQSLLLLRRLMKRSTSTQAIIENKIINLEGIQMNKYGK